LNNIKRNLMKNKFIFFMIIPLLFGIVGCELLDGLDDKKVTDPEVSITYPINGEYYVTLDMFDSETNTWAVDAYGIGYNKIMFSNTASNDKNLVWFDDLTLWPTRAKIGCDPGNKKFLAGEYKSVFKKSTFTTTTQASAIATFKSSYPIELLETAVNDTTITLSGYMKLTIYDGFIMKDATITASKFKADSINVQLEWSDDPGTKYRLAGYRRTGFIEDEH